jgi:hypothetical protein
MDVINLFIVLLESWIPLWLIKPFYTYILFIYKVKHEADQFCLHVFFLLFFFQDMF